MPREHEPASEEPLRYTYNEASFNEKTETESFYQLHGDASISSFSQNYTCCSDVSEAERESIALGDDGRTILESVSLFAESATDDVLISPKSPKGRSTYFPDARASFITGPYLKREKSNIRETPLLHRRLVNASAKISALQADCFEMQEELMRAEREKNIQKGQIEKVACVYRFMGRIGALHDKAFLDLTDENWMPRSEAVRTTLIAPFESIARERVWVLLSSILRGQDTALLKQTLSCCVLDPSLWMNPDELNPNESILHLGAAAPKPSNGISAVSIILSSWKDTLNYPNSASVTTLADFIHLKRSTGETAMHVTIQHNNFHSLTEMLRAGGNPWELDASGLSVFDSVHQRISGLELDADDIADFYACAWSLCLEASGFLKLGRALTPRGLWRLREDTARAIVLERAAEAALSLRQFGELDDLCSDGLQIAPANRRLLALRARAKFYFLEFSRALEDLEAGNERDSTLFAAIQSEIARLSEPAACLGLDQDTTKTEARRKFLSLCRQHHPDRNHKSPDEQRRAANAFIRVSDAWKKWQEAETNKTS